jgi:hypothetical protein
MEGIKYGQSIGYTIYSTNTEKAEMHNTTKKAKRMGNTDPIKNQCESRMENPLGTQHTVRRQTKQKYTTHHRKVRR